MHNCWKAQIIMNHQVISGHMEKLEDFVNYINVKMVKPILSELDNANNHNVSKIVHEINNEINKKLSSPRLKHDTKLKWFKRAKIRELYIKKTRIIFELIKQN